MNWDLFRRENGTIDLVGAFDTLIKPVDINYRGAIDYINSVEDLQPIKSRQAAAVVLATALTIKLRMEF